MLFRETNKQEQPEVIRDDAFYRKHPQIMRLWLVELTSTDGEILQFYVNALTQSDANERASGYAYWLENEKLRQILRNFRMRL